MVDLLFRRSSARSLYVDLYCTALVLVNLRRSRSARRAVAKCGKHYCEKKLLANTEQNNNYQR